MVRKPDREVVVAGVGLHPFGRFPEKKIHDLATEAVLAALDDSGVHFKEIQAAYFGHVMFEGATPGEAVLGSLGHTGIPIVNVENACSSGSTAFWLAYWAVATGQFDVALAFGAEKVPRGPVATTAEDSLDRLIGADFMMAAYALGMRRYMEETGAPPEAFAQVSVKAHRNASLNPFAQYKKVFTLEEVLSSRLITTPLTLYQCCPTSEGGSAAILCGKDVVASHVKDPKRAVTVAGAGLSTSLYGRGEGDEADQILLAAKDAYEMAGLGPEDMDLAQVHDAATSGEVMGIEGIGLARKGTAWRLEMEGETEITGRIPVNTDGGLQAMGHPFGATGIRMIHEIVTQLRGEAGPRQVKKARAGIAQCSGAGGVATVHILRK